MYFKDTIRQKQKVHTVLFTLNPPTPWEFWSLMRGLFKAYRKSGNLRFLENYRLHGFSR